MSLLYWLINYIPNYWIVIYLISAIENLFCTFLFTWKEPKRKLFWLFFGLSIVGYFGLAALFGVYRPQANNIYYYVFTTFLMDILLYGCILLCFDTKPVYLLLDWVGALCVRGITSDFYTFLSLISGVENRTSYFLFPNLNVYLNCFLYDFFRLIVIVPLSLYFRRYRIYSSDKRILRNTIVLSIITGVGLNVTKAIRTWYSGESTALNSLSTFLSFMMALVILLLRTDFLLGSEARREAEILHQALESEQKEYESTKESIHVINAKVHDIKHILERYSDKMALEDLDHLRSSILVYDHMFHTGNEVLDTILYSKYLICQQRGIRFSAYADGKAISFLDVSVCYYLFVNILDNAIEAVSKVKNPEEKVISLTVKQEKENVLIECSNYFEGNLPFAEDGSLKTSKTQKEGHGLGLKSIRILLEQYGGKEQVETYQGIFYLTLKIPTPKEAKKALGNVSSEKPQGSYDTSAGR